MNKPAENDICCLCGNPAAEDDKITREHVPPKQFYPKSIRSGLNLWIVPTHRSCNHKHKSDEEYFYHATYPMVANANPSMASIIFADLERRARKPQTPKLLQTILQGKSTKLPSGIVLPPGVVRLDVNKYKLQQVAIKITQCLFYRDHARYIPTDHCKDIRLCEQESDVPELYRLSWELSKTSVDDLPLHQSGGTIVEADENEGKAESASATVFSYRSHYDESEQLHLYTLMFWEAFAFCLAFEERDCALSQC